MKFNSYNIIRRPVITEKGMAGVESKNQYPFEVAVGANKEEIKRAVQEVFSVRVIKVRTMIRRGKPRGHRVADKHLAAGGDETFQRGHGSVAQSRIVRQDGNAAFAQGTVYHGGLVHGVGTEPQL